MRTVISGGEKTDNIVNAVGKKFENSGDEIITLKFLDDIHEYIDCGYRVDKFIITEQSITSDWAVEDEAEIRSRVNAICNAISNRNGGAEVVFLTHYEDLAARISEESLAVSRNSGIVIKEPPYTISFFTDLISKEVSTLSEELLYTPGDVGEYLGDEEVDEWEEEDVEEEDAEEESADACLEDEENDSEESDSIDWEGEESDDTFDGGEDSLDDSETDLGWEDGDESNWDEGNDEFEDGLEDESDDSFDESDDNFWDDDFSDNSEEDGISVENNEVEEAVSDDWIDEGSSEAGDVVSEIGSALSELSDELYEEHLEDDTEAQIYNDVQVKEEDDKITQALYDEQKDLSKKVNPLPVIESENIQLGEEIIKGRKRLFSKKKTGISTAIKSDREFNIGEVKEKLLPFANRGNSIVVTGCGGSGASTVAMNMANVLAGLGYNVLIVDMDTLHPSQGYITKQAYDSVLTDSKSLVSAINNSVSIEKYTSIVKPGLHLLSMWMGGDCVPIDCTVKKEKIMKFVNMVKGNYNFIIYDIPFSSATTFLSDVTFACDNIVHVIDSSNWGIAKFMLDMCNIEDENMQEAVFNRAELIFNRFKGMNKLFGRGISSFDDILRIIDEKVIDLIGGETGLYFSNLHIVGHINEDRAFEDGWFNTMQYSDTERGREVFINLTAKAVLHV